MDNKIDIKQNYKKINTNRGKEWYIERNKYILNLNYITKNKDKIFEYKFYNDKEIKCPAYIKCAQNGLIIEYNNKHSCVVDEKNKNFINKRRSKKG